MVFVNKYQPGNITLHYLQQDMTNVYAKSHVHHKNVCKDYFFYQKYLKSNINLTTPEIDVVVPLSEIVLLFFVIFFSWYHKLLLQFNK